MVVARYEGTDDSCLNSNQCEDAEYLKLGGIEMGITSKTRAARGTGIDQWDYKDVDPLWLRRVVPRAVTRAAKGG